MIWLCVTQEEFEEIIFGLETAISDRAGSRAEREFPEALIKKLRLQATDKFVGTEAPALVRALVQLSEEGQQGE